MAKKKAVKKKATKKEKVKLEGKPLYFMFLDNLRDEGKANMMAGYQHLVKEYGIETGYALGIQKEWMLEQLPKERKL